MKSCHAIPIALLLLLPVIGHGEARVLSFVKQIGVRWQTARYGWMSFVAFNEDGTMVASDGAATPNDVAGDLTLWSFPDGQLIRSLLGHPTVISSDWKYVAGFNGVTELKTGKILTSPSDTDYTSYAFSPDSRLVAESAVARRSHGSHIRILELPSGKQINAFGRRSAFSLAISPDGRLLAAGHWDLINLWDLSAGQRVSTLRGLGRYVLGIAFSHDGNLLAAGTDTGALQIWDVRQRKRIHALNIGGGDVSTPAFSPDGKLVAVGVYGTGTTWLIDVSNGSIVDQQKVSDLGCGSVAFSPDGRFL